MERGFFRSLFDISFTSFITTKIIKFVYVVTLVLAALAAAIVVIAAFREDTALGIVTLLVVAPVGALIYLVYARLVLELIIQVFRITECCATRTICSVRRSRPLGGFPPTLR
jgi:hypothetical protein